jgi:membrane protein DedA with SNARE-associated domain
VPEFLTGWPFAVVYLFLLFGATCRGQMLYWLGRWAVAQTLRHTHPTGGWRRRAHDLLSSDGTERGIEAIRRWGLVVIPLSYLTVGFQSMVNAGAGVLRIRWWKFSLAQLPGSAAWALIYSTIGFAIWGAAISAAAGSPGGLIAIVVVLLAVVVAVVVHTRRRRRARAISEDRVDLLADGLRARPPPGNPQLRARVRSGTLRARPDLRTRGGPPGT